MEFLNTIAFVGVCNTALVELVKYLLGKTNVILSSTATVVLSWTIPILAGLLAKATGFYDMSVFGAILSGALVAATSNKVFDFFAWVKGQLA